MYVVADNGFAISVPVSDQSPAPVSELVRGFRGLEILRLDGTDYFEVRRRAADAIAHVRAGVGPLLIHADVTRPYSHSAADTQAKYRSERELADEAERDPIGRLEHALVHGGVLSTREASGHPRAGPPDRGRRGQGGAGRTPPRPGHDHRTRRRHSPTSRRRPTRAPTVRS